MAVHDDKVTQSFESESPLMRTLKVIMAQKIALIVHHELSILGSAKILQLSIDV